MELSTIKDNSEIIQVFSVHSGCNVFLMERDGKKFVRKTCSEAYSYRLQKQYEKQKAYKSSVFKVPEVYDAGYSDKVFYFDMEHVSGVSFSAYLKGLDISKIKPLSSTILGEILSSPKLSGGIDSAINEKLQAIEGLSCNGKFNKSIRILRAFDWSQFHASSCHGDLTFENMIVKGDDIYLIDFLDSFVDCNFIDISKLFQDLELFWSFRGGSIDSNTAIRYSFFKASILDQLDLIGKSVVYHFLLLNLLRIIPYVRESHIMNYLVHKIEYLNCMLEGELWKVI